MFSRADQLVDTISANVTQIQKFLDSQGLAGLSIEEDVPLRFQAGPNFAKCKDAALLACKELTAMLSGSFGTLANQPVHSSPQDYSSVAEEDAGKPICEYPSYMPLWNCFELPP